VARFVLSFELRGIEGEESWSKKPNGKNQKSCHSRARANPRSGAERRPTAHDGAMAINALNLQLVIKEYIIKMLNEAGVGMKCLVLDDFTVRHEHLASRGAHGSRTRRGTDL
jgi:hypothetical protein